MPELRRDDDVVARALEQCAESLLGRAVHVSRVEQRDALIERRSHDFLALRLVEFAAEVVRAEPDNRDHEAGRPQPPKLHVSTLEGAHSALMMSSTRSLASPKSIWLLSRKNSGFRSEE